MKLHILTMSRGDSARLKDWLGVKLYWAREKVHPRVSADCGSRVRPHLLRRGKLATAPSSENQVESHRFQLRINFVRKFIQQPCSGRRFRIILRQFYRVGKLPVPIPTFTYPHFPSPSSLRRRSSTLSRRRPTIQPDRHCKSELSTEGSPDPQSQPS